jgi:hypothetical protein
MGEAMSDRTTSEVAIRNRMALPLFRAGKDGPSIFSAGTMNILSRALTALMNPRIVWGERDDVQITDGNTLITLSRSSASESASSRVQQYILTDASNWDYFICRILGTRIDATDPENPLTFRAIGATDIFIAKPFHLRQTPFDREEINAGVPENIGTLDEITYDVTVEAWNGVTFSSSVKRWSFEYKSATFRIATDQTDRTDGNADNIGDNWTRQNQTVIPRFVPAALIAGTPIITNTISPTIIYAASCSGLDITTSEADGSVAVTLLAQCDGWAWSKTS